jgi:LysM repeat protein
MMLRVLCCLGFLLLLAGCDPDVRSLQYEDERNPHIRRALAQMQDQDYSAAAESYEEALASNPKLVQTHYDLGLVYQDKLSDPIAAMYHYSRYLKLSPDSPNRFTVQARLNNAQVQFAVTLPNSPVQNAEVFARLQTEKTELQRAKDEMEKRVTELEARLNETPPAKPDAVATLPLAPPTSSAPAKVTVTATTGSLVTTLPLEAQPAPTRSMRLSAVEIPTLAPELSGSKPVPVPKSSPSEPVPSPSTVPEVPAKPEPAAPSSATRVASHPPGTTYTVQKGDSLWKIASHFFPGQVKEGIEKMRTANPSSLAQGKLLKPGQVLTIP